MDLETYYRQIHGLWINVDRCQKQPIDCCDKGVSQYRTHSNTKRLLKFLSGLNGGHESIKRNILKEVPIPSVETAYSWVKKETERRKIMPPTPLNTTADGHGSADSSSGGIRHRFAALGQPQFHRSSTPRPTATTQCPGSKSADKSKLGAPTVECKNTQEKRASNCWDIPNGGRRGRRRAARAKMAVGIATGSEAAKSNPNTGSREIVNGRGKQREGPSEASGGGRSSGGVVGVGNFADRMNWAEKGGGGSEM